MKKFTIVAIALALLSMVACKNNQKNEQAEEAFDPATETEASLNEKALEANLAELIESAKKIKPVPFIQAQKDGKLVLSAKEKMVKPNYLIQASVINNLATLNQKYHAVGMLTADKNIAEMYEMPTADYGESIGKLLTDINDEALTNFYTLPATDIESNREEYELFVDQEYEEGRARYFWEGITAAMVEQIFILTRDVDKFMPMFTDELASTISFNFICVHDGISKMVELDPEMNGLNQVLEPLYVINAINVEQLRDQLISVKADVEKAREYLLK